MTDSKTYDVIVLGGGIVGASTAYALVRRGKNVLLIDQFEPGHNKGSSHGDGRIVRFNYTESIYIEMAKLAYPAWDSLSREAGKPLIQKTGIIEYGRPDSEAIRLTEANLRDHGIAFESLSGAETNARFPQLSFEEDYRVIYQENGAVAFATPAVLALWELFAKHGGDTLTNTRITSLEASAGRVLVSDGSTTWTAEKLVLASGGWSGMMASQLGLNLPVTVTQEVLAYFAPKDDLDHRVGVLPVVIDYTAPEAPYYALPQVEVPGVKVGWHHTGPVAQADDPHHASERVLESIRRGVSVRFPHLNTQEFEIATCLYTNTPDYHFILDVHPQFSNVVIAAGFSGHGFKFGPALGNILADLAFGQTPTLDLSTFSIMRFQADALHKRVGV